jgi:Kef-type K+ transport system membrane component KefB
MTEHQLMLFLTQVAVLVVAARLGGELALRIGVPQVVGELVLGICLGPSLFGALWPSGFLALFPTDPSQRQLLELMGWIGVIFLVLLSGFETRLGLVRHAGRLVIVGWIGGFFLPFGLGFGLGWMVPSDLIGPGVRRPVFALFLATALSISAIPVIARILLDLDLLRTRIGMVIMATSVADDTVGWIILAVLTGLVMQSRIDVLTVMVAVGGTGLFLLFAFTVGQALVRRAIRASAHARAPFAQATVMLVVVLVGGAITQAIHVHLVLGCFVAGILIGRSPGKEKVSIEAVRHVGFAFFIPLFFAYTGIKVDLTTLTGSALPVAVAALVLACVGKVVGAGLGARVGGLAFWEAVAVGSGRNARGAMELVIAAIGLSVGILTTPMYAIVVLIAVVTTLIAAPMLSYSVARARAHGPSTAPSRTEDTA